MRRLVLVILVLAVVGAASWFALSSDPPIALAARARIALEDLQADPAEAQWAPVEYGSAVEAVETARKELDGQMNRFLPGLRDFGRAEALFEQALTDISIARQASREGRDKARAEAGQVLEAAVAGLGHARTTLLIAPLEGSARPASRELEADLSEAEGEIVRLRDLIAQDKYQEALDSGEVLLEKLSDLVGRVRVNGRR